METRKNQIDDFLDDKGTDMVRWGPKYVVGIGAIDQQHKELVTLTNDLYHACLSGDKVAGAAFKDSMSRMVEYVRFHFSAEQNLLQKMGYPQCAEHAKLHEDLIKSILDAAGKYKEGRKFVPNHFVRTLKDWIFGHIAIEDKSYASFVAEQKKRGLLSDQKIDGWLSPEDTNP